MGLLPTIQSQSNIVKTASASTGRASSLRWRTGKLVSTRVPLARRVLRVPLGRCSTSRSIGAKRVRRLWRRAQAATYQWMPEKKPASANTLRRNPGEPRPTKSGYRQGIVPMSAHGTFRGACSRVRADGTAAWLSATGSTTRPQRSADRDLDQSASPALRMGAHTDGAGCNGLCVRSIWPFDAPMTRSAGSSSGQPTENVCLRFVASGALTFAMTAAIVAATAGGSCASACTSR